MKRSGWGGAGRKLTPKLKLNSHLISPVNAKGQEVKVFRQYKISNFVQIGSGDEKRGLIKAVLESPDLLNELDGAWSNSNLKDGISLTVDLDRNRSPHLPARPTNKISVVFTSTKAEIDLDVVYRYMIGELEFDDDVKNAINFLDHVIRQWPSREHTTIKRSYFNREISQRHYLESGVEATSGIYQSIRMAEASQLVVNVDVSNIAFWECQNFKDIIDKMAKKNDGKALDWRGNNQTSSKFDMIKRLKGTWFTVEYKNQSEEARKRHWKVAAIRPESAKDFKFRRWNDMTGVAGPEITVDEYYWQQYRHKLLNPDLPVVQTTKTIKKQDKHGKTVLDTPIVFPMELCTMQPDQRYLHKLDEKQTSQMIRFAVKPPDSRLKKINTGLRMLGWDKKGFLDLCGLKISPEQIRIEARILEAPRVVFKQSQINPRESGKWNLTNQKFFAVNKVPLVSWGVMVVNSANGGLPAIEKPNADKFVAELVKKYSEAGGLVKNPNPVVHLRTLRKDLASEIQHFYDEVKHHFQGMRIQMLVFILPDTSPGPYLRIKRFCDCQWGVFSQCVQAKVTKMEAYQYMPNLLMKFNAKLGGVTNIIASQHLEEPPKPKPTTVYRKDFGNTSITPPGISRKAQSPTNEPPPTMYIGTDVSHPAPGSQAPSYATMTVSMDKTATRYSAAVQTNQSRDEIISARNIAYYLEPLLQKWINDVGGRRLPDHVYYFRDGVGESRFKELLETEVADIKQIFRRLNGTNAQFRVKFTVVVAEKRHHIRFFPEGGAKGGADENHNPLPGTIVDHDITDPRGNDIYLCSHRALKGTARPTHYTMLMDEANVPVDRFQRILYEHCYQYIRSTTAVSLHPAVYYAHLASKRARAHDISGPGNSQETPARLARLDMKRPETTVNQGGKPEDEWIGHGMWFI
ncbi:MAG: hypothetical protein Q9205_004763 [Flavoplaca limonia]